MRERPGNGNGVQNNIKIRKGRGVKI